MKSKIFAIIILTSLCVSTVNSQVYEYHDGVYNWRLWVPADAPCVKGILFLAPWLGGNTSTWVEDDTLNLWSKVTGQRDFGVLGINTNYNSEHIPFGTEMIKAMEKFSDFTGRSELKSLPFIVHGVSMGGRTGYFLSTSIPNRVLAYFGAVPAIGNSSLNISEESKKVFGFQTQSEYDNVVGVWPNRLQQLRAQGVQVAESWNFGMGHSPAVDLNWWFMFDYLIHCIDLRYPENKCPLDTDFNLNAYPVDSGWLGYLPAPSTAEYQMPIVFPYKEKPDSIELSDCSWLPDKRIARTFLPVAARRPGGASVLTSNIVTIKVDNTGNDVRKISVRNNGVLHPAKLRLYDADYLIAETTNDSLGIEIYQPEGFHEYWASITDSSAIEYPTVVITDWTFHQPFWKHDYQKPCFRIYSSILFMSSSDPETEVIPHVYDTLSDARWSVRNITTPNLANVSIDSLTGRITATPKEDSAGKTFVTIRRHDKNNPDNYFERNLFINTLPVLQLYEIEDIERNTDFNDTIIINPGYVAEPTETSFSISPASLPFVNIRIDPLTGQLTLWSKPGKTGTATVTLNLQDMLNVNNIKTTTFKVTVGNANNLNKRGKDEMFHVYVENNWLHLRLACPETGLFQIKIVNIDGRLILTQPWTKKSFCDGFSMPITNLTKGVFLIEAGAESKTYSTKGFIP